MGDITITDCLKQNGCSVKQGSEKISVENFEYALMATRLFDDGDVTNFINFALVILGNKAIITRYDFDDSFKFLHTEGITIGMREESLSVEVLSKIVEHGYEVNSMLSQINSSYKSKPLSWNGFFNGFGMGHSKLLKSYFKNNIEKILEMFEDFSKRDKSEISTIVKTALEEVKSLANEEAFKNYYNFTEFEEYDDSMSTSDKLADHIINTVTNNFKILEEMYVCVQVEIAYQKEDQASLNEIASKFTFDKNVECLPIMGEKAFVLQDLLYIESDL